MHPLNRDRIKIALALFGLCIISVVLVAFAQAPLIQIKQRAEAFVRAEAATPGATVNDPQYGQVFVGESATKVAAYVAQAGWEVDALHARPPEQRVPALDAIHAFGGDAQASIEYMGTTPDHNVGGRMTEVYRSGSREYHVDPARNIVTLSVDGDLALLKQGRANPKLTEEELVAHATAFLEDRCACFKAVQDRLTFQFHQRASESDTALYFLVWEDATVSTPNRMKPRIQVGITAWGTVISYADFVCLDVNE
jgi:hypothetical protein